MSIGSSIRVRRHLKAALRLKAAGLKRRLTHFGLLAFVLAGCRQDMHDQPRYKPLAESDFFADGRASRPLVEGTIPRGHLRNDDHLYTGRIDGEFAAEFPFPMGRGDLLRGKERYQVFCSPCHGQVGDGEGMIVQRGLRRPETFHSDRLREIPAGYFYDVMTNGFGAMYDYASRIPPRDRWRIAAYVRALQLSQQARFSDVSAEDQKRLEELE